MLVHRMVKKVKDSKVWAKINTKDGGPGSGIKGHTTAEEPTQARPAAKAEEPKGGEGRSFASKEHAQAYINGAAKAASKLLGAGAKQGFNGFEWSKKGGYADAKMKLTRMKIKNAGFKEVDFDQADQPAGNWTRNTTTFQNENGDVVKMTSRYGETSRQNSHSVAYIPKDFNKARERLYAQDADPRGYKVSDQIIKGFLIYKSGKGPATYFAKNENGKEFEGTMEEIKKQIDAYWVKQDEDVMKQKVRDEKIPYVKSGTTRGYIIEVENDKNEVFPWKGYIVTQKGKYYICKEKTKQEAINECKKYIESRESEIRDSKKVKDGNSYNMAVEHELFTYYNIPRSQARRIVERNSQELQKKEDANITVHNAADMLIHKEGLKGFEKIYVQFDSKTKDDLHSEAKPWAKKVLLAMRDIYKSSGDDNIYDLFNDAMGRVSPPSSLKAIIRIYILSGANFGYSEGVIFKGASAGYLDSKTKDKAYHPRWRIKDDKLFRLRSAIKKAKTKDVELSNRAVWRKEDFDKMVAAGNFTIVSKQPWGYEVKVKSGNIYGVEIKDTYTKGSADKKTKDQINPEYIRKRKILVDQLERAKKNRAPIETVENITDMIKKLDEDYDRGSAKDKYTGDPLTKKGQKIMSAMKEKYGKKKGESVFYASKNKGTISGVDGKTRDYRQPKTVKYKGFEIDPYFGQFSDGDIGDETYLIYKNNKLVVSKEFYTVEEAKAYIDKKYK